MVLMGKKKWRNRPKKNKDEEEKKSEDLQKLEKYMYPAIITLLVLICYFNAFNNAFVSDDVYGIVNNPAIGQWKNVTSQILKFFQPLLYFLIYQIDPTNPTLFRVVNILVHIGVANLVFILVRRFINPTAAFIAGALFAVHPILVESVSWISGGIYSWYTLFFLLSFYYYLAKDNITWRYYLSVFFFWMSLVIGVPAIVLSGVFILYELSFGNIVKKWLWSIPYFVLSGLYALLTFRGYGTRVQSLSATNNAAPEVLNPMIQVPVAISEYIRLFLWPDSLTLYQSELSAPPFEYSIRLLVFLIVFGVTVYSFFKNKHIFFGLSLFFLGLLPTLTPISIAWVVAERYAYFSVIGLVYLVGYGLTRLHKKYDGIVYGLLLLTIISLSIRTIVRNNDWHNEDNLWIATVKTSPSDPKSHNNMGDVYARHGDLENAARAFENAIKLNPGYPDAHHNLGNIYMKLGKTKEAKKLFERAIQLNPTLWQPHQNLGAIYYNEGDYQNALEENLTVLKMNPNQLSAYLNVGVIYFQLGDKARAKKYFEIVLSADPNNQMAQQGMIELNKL